jgi:hypothetical protein
MYDEGWRSGLDKLRAFLRALRSLLEPLLELPIERVLVSHGEPVLTNGVSALSRCLAKSERPQ